jgi:hypothetical protein
MQASPSAYPATFSFDPPERVANWRPLVQWILAIPHLAIQSALGTVAEFVGVISWFSILFTGRVPEGLVNFQCMYLRYSMRTMSYAGFQRAEYPPFAFDMTPDDPGTDPRVRVDFRPQLENRNRLTVGLRIFMVIPLFIVAIVYFIASFFVYLIAFFAVLFTGRWPEGMRSFVLKVWAYWLRVQAYFLLLTDQYPPFGLS